jgi:adenylate cyclase class 2
MASAAPIEHEAKILGINIDAFLVSLAAANGTYLHDYPFRRYVFDTNPPQAGTWLRLRTNGTETTLTAKEITDTTIEGTHEREVVVSNFENTLEILQKAGLQTKGYQVNHRFDFKLGDTTVSLDFWPALEPYLEIESPSTESVLQTATALGFAASDLVTKNTLELYQDNGIALDSTPKLELSPEQQTIIAELSRKLGDVGQHDGDHERDK